MKYPTPGQYQEAAQFPATAFADPLLQDAEPETNVLGLPHAITGAFAVVFRVRTRGTRWALKCFLTDVKDQRRRYLAISHHLDAAELPYTVPFEYQQEGIRVDDRLYPLLKMEWIDGESLNRYVARHLRDLQPLIGRWRQMAGDLESAGVAHGDLQHGNILIDEERLRLVDYDTMFVPALAGKRSPEVGHRNYQHPDRDDHDFGPHVDRFSALVIDTALQACANRPDLWERFDNGENMLFRSEDLADPPHSALFEELRRIDPIRAQVDALERACFLEPERVPPLSEVVADSASVPRVSGSRRRRKPAPERSAQRDAFEAGFLPAVGIAVVAVATAGAVFGWLIAAGLAACAIVVGTVLVGLRYRRIPSVRRYRRLLREDAYFNRLVRGLKGELATMRMRREAFLGSLRDRAEQRLEEIRTESLDERLKHHFIGEARGFDGLTHKAIVRLKAAGIRTASHATPENVEAVMRLSPKSKARVNLWRSTLASQYGDDIPTSLSPAESRRLKRHLERQLAHIDREIARTRRKLTTQQAEHTQIQDRLAAQKPPSRARYTAYLLRLRKATTYPPGPANLQPATKNQQPEDLRK